MKHHVPERYNIQCQGPFWCILVSIPMFLIHNYDKFDIFDKLVEYRLSERLRNIWRKFLTLRDTKFHHQGIFLKLLNMTFSIPGAQISQIIWILFKPLVCFVKWEQIDHRNIFFTWVFLWYTPPFMTSRARPKSDSLHTPSRDNKMFLAARSLWMHYGEIHVNSCYDDLLT